jgi:hypothetical protein
MPDDEEDYDTRREMETLLNRRVARPSRSMGNSMLGNPMGEMMMPEMIMSKSDSSKPPFSSFTQPVVEKTNQPSNVFDKAMGFVLPHEGGFVHHKNDRGGATNRGITQKTLSGYLGKNASIDDVKNLDKQTAINIYKNQFFEPIAKKLKDPKAQMVAFNAAIASGPKYANKLIEKHQGDPYAMLDEHTNFMVNEIPKKDPSQKAFVKGWQNRQNDLKKYIDSFAGGGEVKHFVEGDYVEGKMNLGPRSYGATDSTYTSTKSEPNALERFFTYNPEEQQRNWENGRRARINMARSEKDKIPYNDTPVKPGETLPKTLQSPKGGIRDFDYVNTTYAMSDPDSDQVSRRNINTNYGENVKPAEQQMGPPIELMGKETNTETAPNKPDFRDLMQQHLMDSWNNQGKQAEQDKWMSLLSAGLGMMGGTSPYAAANIGQGAQQGIAAHLAARKAQQAQQNSLLSGYGILSKDKYYDAIADKSGIAAEALEHKKANDIIANAKTGMNSAMNGLRLANAEKALLKDDSGYKNAVSFVNAYGSKKDLNPSQQSRLDDARNVIRSKELPIQNKINEFNKIYNYHATNLGVPGIGGNNEGGGSNTIDFNTLK